MTKTPEELTEDWKAGKLEDGWWVKQQDGADLLSLQMFDIAPVDNWETSLRKVGGNE